MLEEEEMRRQEKRKGARRVWGGEVAVNKVGRKKGIGGGS